MDFLQNLFRAPPCPPDYRNEVQRLTDELVQIGQSDDFLSERPGGAFNAQSRHRRARAIGERLNEIGGMALMEYVHKRVRKKLGGTLAAHLAYAWSEIGKWVP